MVTADHHCVCCYLALESGIPYFYRVEATVAGEHAARVLRSMLPLRLQAANWAVSDSLAGDDGDVADRALWLEHGHRTYVLAHTALVQE